MQKHFSLLTGLTRQPVAPPAEAHPFQHPSCQKTLVALEHARNRSRTLHREQPSLPRAVLHKADREQRKLVADYETCGAVASLPAAAHELASSPERIVLLTSCNKAYTAWLDHFLRNLAMFGLERRLGVCAEDEETVAFSRARGLSSAFVSVRQRQRAGGALDYGTDAYFELLHRRQLCFWSFLQARPANAMVLLVDTDFTFLQDPLAALPPRALAADVTILDDTGLTKAHNYTHHGIRFDTYANAGFMLLRNTPATQALGRRFLVALNEQRKANDQMVLNEVMWPAVRSHLLEVEVLEPTAFLNGFRFFEGRAMPTCRKPMWCAPLIPSRIVAVHHNWVRGDARKWARAATYELTTRANESSAAFLRRARHAARAMPPWDWQTGNPIKVKAAAATTGRRDTRLAMPPVRTSRTALKSKGSSSSGGPHPTQSVATSASPSGSMHGVTSVTCMVRIVGDDCPGSGQHRTWWPVMPPAATRSECTERRRTWQSACTGNGTVELLDSSLDSMEI